MIAKADLEHDAYYEGSCRNATVARWDAVNECFVHWRYKFGQRYTETIMHPDDDARYDVFYAERKVEPTPETEIPLA